MSVSSVAVYSYQPVVADALKKAVERSKKLCLSKMTVLQEEVDEIAQQYRPDVFIIDCGKADHGLSCIKKLRSALPATKIVLFTGIENSEHAVLSLDAGAAGYISSACVRIDVTAALELIAEGQIFISPHVATGVIKRMRDMSIAQKKAKDLCLNRREEQIARFLLQGWTNRAMAESLGLSEKTIKHYMSTLMQKFAVKNRLELAMALPREVHVTNVHH